MGTISETTHLTTRITRIIPTKVTYGVLVTYTRGLAHTGGQLGQQSCTHGQHQEGNNEASVEVPLLAAAGPVRALRGGHSAQWRGHRSNRVGARDLVRVVVGGVDAQRAAVGGMVRVLFLCRLREVEGVVEAQERRNFVRNGV